MSCCCTNTYNLCQAVGTCADDKVDLPYTAFSPNANFTLRLSFLNSEIEFKLTSDSAGFLQLPTEFLNENYTYTAKLFDENGNQQSFTKDSFVYDCFSFTTKPVLRYADEDDDGIFEPEFSEQFE